MEGHHPGYFWSLFGQSLEVKNHSIFGVTFENFASFWGKLSICSWGLSTWVDGYIRACQITNLSYGHTDQEGQKGKFAYDLPKNVVMVHENFLALRQPPSQQESKSEILSDFNGTRCRSWSDVVSQTGVWSWYFQFWNQQTSRVLLKRRIS